MEQALKTAAGGVDMPPKTDRHDMTTPSGEPPMFIHHAVWDELARAGKDMRWYAVPQRIPLFMSRKGK